MTKKLKIVEPTLTNEYTSIELSNILNFYNSEFSKSDSKEWLISYLRLNGFKIYADIIKNVAESNLVSTYGFVARTIINNDLTCIKLKNKIIRYVEGFNNYKEDIEKKLEVIKPSRQMSSYDIDTALAELEHCIDMYAVNDIEFSLKNQILILNVPKKHYNDITSWRENKINEFKNADSEYYGNFSKVSINKLIKMLGESFEEVKQPRKPRTSKKVDPLKMISKLNYMKHYEDKFSLESDNPIRLPSAKLVLLYNTRYKTLQLYKSNSVKGLMVKGSSIIDFNKNFGKKVLKKPEEQLREFLLLDKQTDIISKFDELKSVTKGLTGRVDDNTIILKILS